MNASRIPCDSSSSSSSSKSYPNLNERASLRSCHSVERIRINFVFIFTDWYLVFFIDKTTTVNKMKPTEEIVEKTKKKRKEKKRKLKKRKKEKKTRAANEEMGKWNGTIQS